MSWETILREAKKQGKIKINFGGNNMNDIDWTKAPEEATHYCGNNEHFYKVSGEECFIHLSEVWEKSIFNPYDVSIGNDFIQRPIETKKVEKGGYELADGTFHSDYEIGDTFKVINEDDDFPEGSIITLCEHEACFAKSGYFSCDNDNQIIYWRNLVAANKASPKQAFEWKIKHIKANDYKCGRDVALTILYKDIGDSYYEYKYAICSPKEMFSRKEGVKEALKKPDTWKVYVDNYKTKGALQIIVWHLPFTRKMSGEVIDLLLLQGFYNP